MTSTVEKTLTIINGLARIVPKQYPDWYGIEGIGFISHGEWSDPELEYKGKRFNAHDVEDAMWDRFCEEHPECDEDEFIVFMWEHQDEVIELCENVIKGGN